MNTFLLTKGAMQKSQVTLSLLYSVSQFMPHFLALNIETTGHVCQSVQFSCPVISDSCDHMNHSTPGLPVHHQLPEFTQTHVIELVMPSSHLILCRPLLLLPPIPPSIRIFSNESTLHMRWPKYWTLSISPSNEHPGQISFRMDWLDLLAVQGTLKTLLQHHSSKASIVWPSAFFTVQLTSIHDHWKNHSLD